MGGPVFCHARPGRHSSQQRTNTFLGLGFFTESLSYFFHRNSSRFYGVVSQPKQSCGGQFVCIEGEKMRGLQLALNKTQKLRLENALQQLESLSFKLNSNATVTVADSIPVNYEDGVLKYAHFFTY